MVSGRFRHERSHKRHIMRPKRVSGVACAAKGGDDVSGGTVAVRHMASSLAVEWAKKGVRVNTLR